MAELPRVLVCSFDVVPRWTGSAWRLREAITALTSHFQVTALTLKTPELTHIENYQGARMLRVPLTGADEEARLQTFSRAVRRQLESEEYALVYFTDCIGGMALLEAHGQHSYKVLYDATRFLSVERDPSQLDTPDVPRFLARLHRQELACLMGADAVLTGSPLTRTFLEGVGVPPDGVHVLRTPARLAFEPAPLPSQAQALRLVYVGSAERWQGLELLLQAAALACVDTPLDVTLVGQEHPVHTPVLKALARAPGLDGHVHFQAAVRREQLPSLIAQADLGVAPLLPGERHEQVGAPLAKVSDYLASGRGVVISDTPAARALLDDEVATFFPPGDPQALAEALRALARDPLRRLRMGEKARAHAEARLGVLAFRTAVRTLSCRLADIDPSREELPPEPEDYTVVNDDQALTLQRAEAPDGSSERTQLQARPSPHPPTATPVETLITDPAAQLPLPPEPDAQTASPMDPWQALALHGYTPMPTRSANKPPLPTSDPGPDPS